MIHYSVLLPQRDASQAIAAQLPALCQALERLILPYEIVCIDDASSAQHTAALRALLNRVGRLRVLAFDQPRGMSASLTAGIAAARGELVVAAAPDVRLAAHWLPHFIARLAHADLVFAHRPPSPGARLRGACTQAVRRLMASRDLGVDEALLWAARREALVNLTLPRGAFRFLPTLVAERGFRVMRLTLSANRPAQGAAHRPAMLARLLARWLGRRYEPHLAGEWPTASAAPAAAVHQRFTAQRTYLPPRPATARADEPRPHIS